MIRREILGLPLGWWLGMVGFGALVVAGVPLRAWLAGEFDPPYLADTASGVVHRRECGHLNTVRDRSLLEEFDEIDAALAAGCRPCGHCLKEIMQCDTRPSTSSARPSRSP